VNWLKPAAFERTASFMGVPSCPDDMAEAPPLACIVGLPFDCGTHPFRVGSRQGPDAIREQSRLIRDYDLSNRTEISNPSEFLRLVDVGNVRCAAGDPDKAFPVIEQAITEIMDSGAIPIGLGGDGAVTLPQLRAVGKRYPDLVVLHFDAHTDTYPIPGYNTATTFSRAAEEGVIDVKASYHVGARGTSFMPDVWEHTRAVGYSVVPFDTFEPDQTGVLDRIRAEVGDRPVYMCFDMDIFDPSCAPGVCTPEWGGLSARQGLGLLRALSGLNFVAFDVNTVSPPHDVGGTTAFLAATVVNEFLALAAVAVRTYPKAVSASR